MAGRWALARVKAAVLCVLPQPVQSLVHKRAAPSPTKKRPASATSWMDGLRGYSAILILWIHMLEPYEKIGQVFWHNIRFFFFVISGYVISSGCLKAFSAGKVDVGLSRLSTSAFRRFFRIHIPVILTFILIGLLCQAHAFDSLRPYFNTDNLTYFSGLWGPFIPWRAPTLRGQLWDVARMSRSLINVYDTNYFHCWYNAFFWTIRSEYRASVILTLCLFVFSPLEAGFRMLALFCVMQLSALYGRWEVVLIMWGALVAQGEVIIRSYQADKVPASPRSQEKKEGHGAIYLPPSPRLPEDLESQSRLVIPTESLHATVGKAVCNLAWTILYCFAIYLCTFPSKWDKPYPAYRWVMFFVPRWWKEAERLVAGAGAALFISAMLLAPTTSLPHRVFNNRLGSYLGTQFFGILACSWITLCSGGYWLPEYGWRYLGGSRASQGFNFWRGYLPAGILNTLLAVWAADIWTRTIDAFAVYLIAKITKHSFRRER